MLDHGAWVFAVFIRRQALAQKGWVPIIRLNLWERIMITVIYYFTGTGNSLQIAKDVAKGIPNCE
jgi:hypothetical protein